MVEMEYIFHMVLTMVFPFACASVGGICMVGGIFARSRGPTLTGGQPARRGPVLLCAAFVLPGIKG